MNTRSHHERKSSGSHFQIRHALPRCEHRFRLPTNYRRMSGGNAGEASAKYRRNRRWTSGGKAVAHPLTWPLSLPGNFPAIVGTSPAHISANHQTRFEQQLLGERIANLHHRPLRGGPVAELLRGHRGPVNPRPTMTANANPGISRSWTCRIRLSRSGDIGLAWSRLITVTHTSAWPQTNVSSNPRFSQDIRTVPLHEL